MLTKGEEGRRAEKESVNSLLQFLAKFAVVLMLNGTPPEWAAVSQAIWWTGGELSSKASVS